LEGINLVLGGTTRFTRVLTAVESKSSCKSMGRKNILVAMVLLRSARPISYGFKSGVSI
jgi:hypothetical protein